MNLAKLQSVVSWGSLRAADHGHYGAGQRLGFSLAYLTNFKLIVLRVFVS